MPLYKPFKYKGKGVFKYSVIVKSDTGKDKIIHFGDSRYQDYRQHKDEKRSLFSPCERYQKQKRRIYVER